MNCFFLSVLFFLILFFFGCIVSDLFVSIPSCSSFFFFYFLFIAIDLINAFQFFLSYYQTFKYWCWILFLPFTIYLMSLSWNVLIWLVVCCYCDFYWSYFLQNSKFLLHLINKHSFFFYYYYSMVVVLLVWGL